MRESRELISIWFFIGTLLLIYGVLITGAGVYGVFVPPEREVAMGRLHAGVWWGVLLTVIGAFYCRRFYPWKKQQ